MHFDTISLLYKYLSLLSSAKSLDSWCTFFTVRYGAVFCFWVDYAWCSYYLGWLSIRIAYFRWPGSLAIPWNRGPSGLISESPKSTAEHISLYHINCLLCLGQRLVNDHLLTLCDVDWSAVACDWSSEKYNETNGNNELIEWSVKEKRMEV